MGESRFARAKRALVDLGLIEQIQQRNDEGHFEKCYIRLKYTEEAAVNRSLKIRGASRNAAMNAPVIHGERKNRDNCFKQ
jgi:hypothetical protein